MDSKKCIFGCYFFSPYTALERGGSEAGVTFVTQFFF